MIVIIVNFSLAIANANQSHLQQLRKEFPYGLLTNDFGILNKQDLRTNTCIAGPIPFSEDNQISPYPYWQCFEIKNTKMTCERGKYDSHEEVVMSMLVVSAMRNGELHEFISRRPIPLWSCRLYRKDWLKLTRNEPYICVSGSDHSKKISGKKTCRI